MTPEDKKAYNAEWRRKNKAWLAEYESSPERKKANAERGRRHYASAKGRAQAEAYKARPEVKARARESARVRRALPGRGEIAVAKFREKRYGVSPARYQAMLATQNLVCDLCHQACVSGKSLAVDHDHATGYVRSLLCGNCNAGLGKFQDSPELLRKAAVYIEYHSRKQSEVALV